MNTERLSADGVEISFTAEGKGPGLLLLHGWPQTSYEWREIIRGEVIESCGHGITEERPRELTGLLLDFLGR